MKHIEKKILHIKDVSEAINFLEDLKKQGRKAATLYLYRYALQKKLNTKIPYKIQKQIQIVEIPEEEEIQQLLNELQKRNYSLYLIAKFLIWTGCRISEALNIKLSDIEIQKDVVRIRVLGKGKKERYVFLEKKEYEEIFNYFHQYDKYISSEPFLFLNSNLKRFDRCFVSRKIIQISKQTIGKKISPHKLRHFFATRTLNETKDINAVSKYLGHSNIQTTAQFYLHTFLNLEDIKNALKCVLI